MVDLGQSTLLKRSVSRICPACSGKVGVVISTIEMDIPTGISLPNKYDIVCCETCGNCYADTFASAEAYDDYYSNHNYYGGGWKYNTSTYTDYTVMARIIKDEISCDASIIDMGCGNGGLIKHLHSEGLSNLMGVDPSKEAVDSLRKDGFRAAIGSVYRESVIGCKADVVIMAMVLEHLLEPEKAIKNIRNEYLKENGYILLSWPRFEDLIVDESPILNNFNHEHINYFSIETADWMMQRCGFERVCNHTSLGFHHGIYTTFSNVALYKLSSIIRQVRKDTTTQKSILEYIRRVSEKESVLIQKIHDLAESQKETIVWGTGAYMMHLMSSSELKDCNILCFIDNNKLKRKDLLYGYEVNAPESIENFDGTIVITAMLYAKDIVEQIREKIGNTICRILS